TNPANFLRQRIERSRPTRIVWHAERPTPWEGWLVRQLVAAGGEARVFRTPLAAPAVPFGIQVVTPWDAREAALAVVRDLAGGSSGPESKCVGLAPRGVTEARAPAFLLAAPATAGIDRPPPWLTGSYREVRFGNTRWDLGVPISAAVDEIGDHGARLDVI